MIVFLTHTRMKIVAFVSVLFLSVLGLVGSASAGALVSAPKTLDHRATIVDKAPVAKVGHRYRRSYRRGRRGLRLRFGRHYGYGHRYYRYRPYRYRHYRYRPYRYRHYGYYRPRYRHRHYRRHRIKRHFRRYIRRHLRHW